MDEPENSDDIQIDESPHLDRSNSWYHIVRFTTIFILGSVVIYFNFSIPIFSKELSSAWIVTIFVVLYGFWILVDSNYARRPILQELKDSPYFLGFLFTLTSIALSFRNISLLTSNSTDVLIVSLGTAVLTTIAGLIWRFVLYLLSESEDWLQEKLLSLEDDLKRSTSSFVTAQKSLVSIIEEYSSSRKMLFEEEKEAWANLIDQLNVSSEELRAAIEDNVDKFNSSMSSNISALSEGYSEAVSLTSDSKTQLIAEMDNMKCVLETINDANDQLIKVVNSYEQNSIDQHLKETAKTINEFSAAISDLCHKCDDTQRKLVEMAYPAPEIRKDLNDINGLLDEFLELLNIKLRKWNSM